MPFLTPAVQADLGYFVAFIMIIGAAINTYGPVGIRAAYARWGYPKGFRFVTAFFEGSAAALILLDETRTIGLGLGAAVMLAAIATLVRARQYSHSLPALVVLAASALALT